ncbi:MAG: hypothetical protein K0S74_1472 [Chlamydiales bacterium]|jgi:hypothetical protein|nr:hypothetical protein [Chlamydiales bacterium]
MKLERFKNNNWIFSDIPNNYKVEIKAQQGHHVKILIEHLKSQSIDLLPGHSVILGKGKHQLHIKKAQKSLFTKIISSIPFFKNYSDDAHLILEIEKTKQSIQKEGSKNDFPCFPAVDLLHNSFSKNSTIPKKSFTDPFTLLAEEAFQYWEPNFVPTDKVAGTYRIVLNHAEKQPYYTLAKIKESKLLASHQYKEENRITVQSYLLFLLHEYGAERIERFQSVYNLNLRKMIQTGEPLQAEHIYRMNMAVSYVELDDARKLLFKLRKTVKNIERLKNDQTLENILKAYVGQRDQKFFGQEIRGIIRNWEEPNQFLNWLKKLPEDLKDATVEQVDQIVRILMPEAGSEHVFTGRKIINDPIMGFYTQADKSSYKPWLDQQELLQVFPDIQNSTSWENFYEIISHVIVKKHLVQKGKDNQWRVGALIPGPKSSTGDNQWYVVSSCCDNNYGNFSYTMEPLSKEANLPAIKLYRSTAGDPYQMNGFASVEADFYPFGSPGSRGFDLGNKYEKRFFEERTIPVWVGYYLKAQEEKKALETSSHLSSSQQKALWKQVLGSYNCALEELAIANKNEESTRDWDRALGKLDLKQYIFNIDSSRLSTSQVDYTFLNHVDKVLEMYGKHFKELPEYKKAQDLSFAGHSLGGTLAQQGMYHFLAEAGRIPLPKHAVHAYCSDAPAGISAKQNEKFLEFGRKHQALFHALDQKWSIDYNLEYGDFVPLVGEEHLGVIRNPQERKERTNHWLKLDMTIFTPKVGAKVLAIKNAISAHARRFALGESAIDYDIKKISTATFARLRHTYLYKESDRKLLGYKTIYIPKALELGRKLVGLTHILPTIRKIKQFFSPARGHEARDKHGIFYVDLDPANALAAMN